MSYLKFGATCLLVLPLALACSGGNSDDPFGGAGQGTVTVQVYDAPVTNLEAAHLTFSSVELHDAEGWHPLEGTPITIDLLAHLGASNAITVGAGAVDPGTYDAVRFTVIAATLTVEGSPVELPLPEGGVSATVLHGFTVTDGGEVEIEMHLNPATSFQIAGTGYTFTPTVDQVASH